MITLSTVQEILSETFFDNNMQIAGIVLYIGIISLAFYFVKNLTAVMIISIPVTLIFASMNILTGDLLIVMIIIIVIGVAIAAGRTIAGRD